MQKILLLSAYKSDSHASWVRALKQAYANDDLRVLELPGRYFRWRIRGNPLSWLDELPALLNDFQPEQIIATSMVDIVTIKGLFPQLAHVPVIYYFHENQFAYPQGVGQHNSIDPMMVQLYGALAATECQFNSDYNRRTFLEGVEALMRKMPDHKPNDLRARIEPKCKIVPVPVTPINSLPKIPGLIIWNHRWEYDKNPELFLEILRLLKAKGGLINGAPFKLALLGPRPVKPQKLWPKFAQNLPSILLPTACCHAPNTNALSAKASLLSAPPSMNSKASPYKKPSVQALFLWFRMTFAMSSNIRRRTDIRQGMRRGL